MKNILALSSALLLTSGCIGDEFEKAQKTCVNAGFWLVASQITSNCRGRVFREYP